MNNTDIKALLLELMPESIINVAGEDCNFTLTVISDDFQSLSPVKRHQIIYSYLKTYITSGEIHAASMNLMTYAEHDAAHGAS